MIKVTEKERQTENEQILRNLREIKIIVEKKCKRCDSMVGCLGCTFSQGELMHDVDHGIELMERLCGVSKENE